MSDLELQNRIGDINRLDIRVSILEAAHLDLIKSKDHHDSLLDRLLTQDAQMVTALELIGANLENLKSLFSTGFKVVCICAVVVTSAIGAFWAYSMELDKRYLPKVEQMARNTEIISNAGASIKADMTEQNEDIESVKADIKNIKKLKVIQASKKGR